MSIMTNVRKNKMIALKIGIKLMILYNHGHSNMGYGDVVPQTFRT